MSQLDLLFRFTALLILGVYTGFFMGIPSESYPLAGPSGVIVLAAGLMFLGWKRPIIGGILLIALSALMLLRPSFIGHSGEVGFWVVVIAMPLIAGVLDLATLLTHPHHYHLFHIHANHKVHQARLIHH